MKSRWQVIVVIDHGAEEPDQRVADLLGERLDGLALDPKREQTGPRVHTVPDVSRMESSR